MSTQPTSLEGGTYEIILQRLKTQAQDLRGRMDALNQQRKVIFGAVDTTLIANDRITTEHNCISRDMVALGHHFLFGYNVHMGLRTEVKLSDVFAAYRFESADHSFHAKNLDLLSDERFQEDFTNLYKYYKHTVFSRFAVIGPHLFMVFQVGKSHNDVKTFKWAIKDEGLMYLGNRFDHELVFPAQHQFQWQRSNRDMHRRGSHPHVSIQDRVFVETVGGDLTIKVEDNTDSGHGIYAEPVDDPAQTLDDAEYAFADLGNLIALRIKPYQEKDSRYFLFNEKAQEVRRVDSIEHSCVLLPDDQGVIFANGYYLQTGEFQLFETLEGTGLHFEKRIAAPNGEDFLYIFTDPASGTYVLLNYNLVEQRVATPIVCNGYSIFPNGELSYFRSEDTPGRHHLVQVWQTPYTENQLGSSEHSDTWLYKVGNKDLVRGIGECNELLTLLNKEDSYHGLYVDLVRKSGDILDSYYWINHQEAQNLSEPLAQIRDAANSAIDEFEKVTRIRANTKAEMDAVSERVQDTLDRIRRYKPQQVDQFVQYLADLRTLRGEIISLRELRYVDLDLVEQLDQSVEERSAKISEQCVQFLVDPKALEPYGVRVDELIASIESVAKVTEADELQERMDGVGKELELLIDIVSNLKIADATQTTQIIDHISTIYARLNGLRGALKQRRQEMQGMEAEAEFGAQIRLLGQSIINYLDLCDSPQKCEEYLTKLMVQVEELEGKFAEYDHFLQQIGEKREELYQAFESRRLSLVEARNRRTDNLQRAAERILKGIGTRLAKFEEAQEINAYFASDLMVNKVRDIIESLEELEDSVKAGDIQSRLKTLREDAVRQLKDRKELFVGGENVLQFGRHHFSVNVQPLELSIVPRGDGMYFHLSGTNFFEEITDAEFRQTQTVWNMSLPSENLEVYRAEFLAYQMLQADLTWPENDHEEEWLQLVKEFSATRFEEGYIKGVHDLDAAKLVRHLVDIRSRVGGLRYSPEVRTCAKFYWERFVEEHQRTFWERQIQTAGLIVQMFPDTHEFDGLIESIAVDMLGQDPLMGLFPESIIPEASEYLFRTLALELPFGISGEAAEVYEQFAAHLKKQRLATKFRHSLELLQAHPEAQFTLVRQGLRAWAESVKLGDHHRLFESEAALLVLLDDFDGKRVKHVELFREITGMVGEHGCIKAGTYLLDYHDLMERVGKFERETLPMYQTFRERKQTLTDEFRETLRLDEFKPRVMSAFVRNQLIDKLYLPIIGDNLAKQIGTVGEQTRTDRMGMLLLISPPGYGKTTLMEYVANRLGLIFMKVNGPAIGHQVTSLDPSEAPNAAAREELAKLNLALEMGDNIMLYLDDIQHCHPEFLQKFISLCDAQRKIEGVYKGKTRTYDLRGKKVAVVMAGNPYTESGEKFQIPDMLANRADTYNLGDIIGDQADVFKLSYIENALTSNPILSRLTTKPHQDILTLVKIAETGQREGLDFESNLTSEEISESVNVLQKLFVVRDAILNVNQAYIESASQQDEYRVEPRFQLQGSYRNMNRLAEKVMPIMNDEEVRKLVLAHYEQESQTLTAGAEANLLKFKQMNDYASEGDEARWADICEMFRKQKELTGDRLGQLVREMGQFSEGLKGIQAALESRSNGSHSS
ncbi:DNA repair ATPase [Pontibacter sp. G13]|uniref:DNA repair ATPase n=1 Tax=Pontibacter sp. G13 TaxID=3074898 RepID=UPI00288C6016|nr:DNA repair ATPase [Pontibacter sp. G13]WNJ19789.1 DNA repair ATPase [Pontibacter sp. G13]